MFVWSRNFLKRRKVLRGQQEEGLLLVIKMKFLLPMFPSKSLIRNTTDQRRLRFRQHAYQQVVLGHKYLDMGIMAGIRIITTQCIRLTTTITIITPK